MTLLKAQPAAVWGFLIAHMGIAICLVGITGMSVWASEDAKVLKLGESMTVSGYEFTLKSITPGAEQNFQKLVAEVEVTKDGRKVATLKSARRFYQVRDMITTEAGIQVRPMRNLYAGVGEGDAEKGWVVRAYVHFLVNWIWLGALMIALAGFVSILDRGQKRSQKRGQKSDMKS